MSDARAGLTEWGDVIKLARRAAMLATEEMRVKGVIKDPLDSSVLLYTDDPTTAGIYVTEPDMAAICKTSAIEDVCIVMGDKFPPASHEAERDDPELPRVAAMYFTAPGEKCPRCRNFTRRQDAEVCRKCDKQIAVRAALEGGAHDYDFDDLARDLKDGAHHHEK